ncbi:DUF106 domain containing protein [Trichuris trichiura]|uniref:Calcium load-activated calcium channel n=1 Tax=Trichuris trichiura TaxID=36087 RepID=A0A077Z8W7_TRITR|nr:DUF106 domain containing protein [Trichuris trichiura]
MFESSICIVFIATCTAVLGEALTYLIVYRNDRYKRLKSELERQSKRLEKKKDQTTDVAERANKRKIGKQEERLKETNRDLSLFKMKSMFGIGLAFTALLSTFSSMFDGQVVAKLPFTPVSFLQGLSHRNLAGDDLTDCSFIFLYIISTMSIRQNLQKFLGFAPSRAMSKQSQLGMNSMFSPPDSYR